MSEIYKNSSQVIHLDVIGAQADNVTATAYKGDDTTTLTVTGPETVDGDEQWSAVVSFALTNTDGEVKVVWNFEIDGEAVSKTDYLDVVTPYVTINLAREELELGSNISDDKIIAAERRARRIIDRYCRQSFGLSNETMYIRGNGTNFINLPKRLISVTDASRSDYPFPLTGYEIRNNGMTMKRMLSYDTYDEPITTNPIFAPYPTASYIFPEGVEWYINGLWGYERVPGPVQEAALILMEQRLCPDSLYRDRFITEMAASDWRWKMDPGAFEGTGDVVADQLLSDYVFSGVNII